MKERTTLRDVLKKAFDGSYWVFLSFAEETTTHMRTACGILHADRAFFVPVPHEAAPGFSSGFTLIGVPKAGSDELFLTLCDYAPGLPKTGLGVGVLGGKPQDHEAAKHLLET